VTAFAQYDDGVEHSVWLALMRDRIELLWKLLADSGSLWITIDDNECHYLKVLCDEIFGRANFVASITWEKDEARHNDAVISGAHDHILLYAKNFNLGGVSAIFCPEKVQGMIATRIRMTILAALGFKGPVVLQKAEAKGTDSQFVFRLGAT
jgi:DNA methylase